MALADVEASPADDLTERSDPISAKRLAGPAWCAVLILVALVIGMWNVSESGPKWPDGPRYANGGAMIHDWILSGELLHPYRFAKKNYAQYPGFSIPYHPPGYPGLLALWFLVVGMSYASARCFVALCFGLAACFFYGTMLRLAAASEIGSRKSAIGNAEACSPTSSVRPPTSDLRLPNRWIAMAGSLLLLTAPELVLWTRSTMSEIPALMFILAGSYCFVAWVNTKRPAWCWAAFALAEMAFLCRVTTIGILPAWFLFLAYKKEYRRFFSPHVIVPAILFLVGNTAWVKFAKTFSQHEMSNSLWERLLQFQLDIPLAYLSKLPVMVGWITLALAAIGLVAMFRGSASRSAGLFWLFWFACCLAFHLVVLKHFEPRYFVFTLPAICGLAAGVLSFNFPRRLGRLFAPAVVAVAIVANLVVVSQLPRGLRGNGALAARLSRLDEPGNVLMSCWMDQDLIFRLRSHPGRHQRQLIRGDRSLAIRLPSYAGVDSKNLAKTPDDVLETIRRGRVRYLLTCPPTKPNSSPRPADMVLAHNTATSLPRHFSLVDRFDLVFEDGGRRKGEVFLWRFTGELPSGSSEIPIVIPTARWSFRPDSDVESVKPESGQEQK